MSSVTLPAEARMPARPCSHGHGVGRGGYYRMAIPPLPICLKICAPSFHQECTAESNSAEFKIAKVSALGEKELFTFHDLDSAPEMKLPA